MASMELEEINQVQNSWKIDFGRIVSQICQMKTVLIRDFTRRFSSLRHQTLQVRQRGKVVGTWTPIPEEPVPVDFMKRLREDFKSKLPFTGAELLKEGKKR